MFFSNDELFNLMLLRGGKGGGSVEATATGNPLTFLTDLSKPLKSLLIPFAPKQTGSGDPSPVNVRPIVPWDRVTVEHGGSNLLLTADIIIGKWINGSGATNNDSRGAITSKIEVESSAVYILSYNGLRPLSFAVVELNASGGFIKRNYVDTDQTATDEISFSTNANTKAIICEIYTRDGDMTEAVLDSMKWQFEKGSRTDYNDTVTDTDISFPSPVYGGTLDAVTGVLTVEWVAVEFNGSQDEQWQKLGSGSASAFAMKIQIADKNTNTNTFMCDSLKSIARTATWGNFDNWISDNGDSIVTGIQSITTVEAWKEYLAENPITVAYKLKTAHEVTLSGEQLTALVGNNTIWSDADGEMTATYYKKG